MGNLNFKPRTLDDEIIKDGLCAVSKLEDNPNSKGMYFLVGGIAAQSYLPTICRRRTTDIDLGILRPLNYSEFQEFADPVIQFLKSNGYSTSTKKGHISYNLFFNTSEGDAAVIEFARRSETNYEKMSQKLEREMRNSRVKVVEGRKDTIRVKSPEDIVVPKLVRCVGSLKRHDNFSGYLNDQFSFPLTDHDIAKRLNNIFDLRQEVVLHAGNPELAERLRFVSDIYDIQVLSEIVGFNLPYLNEVMSSWDALSIESNQKKQLITNLLPRLNA